MNKPPILNKREQALHEEMMGYLESFPEFSRLWRVKLHLDRACEEATEEENSSGLSQQLRKAESRWQAFWMDKLEQRYGQRRKGHFIQIFRPEEKDDDNG